MSQDNTFAQLKTLKFSDNVVQVNYDQSSSGYYAQGDFRGSFSGSIGGATLDGDLVASQSGGQYCGNVCGNITGTAATFSGPNSGDTSTTIDSGNITTGVITANEIYVSGLNCTDRLLHMPHPCQ